MMIVAGSFRFSRAVSLSSKPAQVIQRQDESTHYLQLRSPVR